MKKAWILFLFIGIIQATLAQNVQFNVSADPRIVIVGEQFQLTYTVNANPSGNPAFPNFPDFQILSGPYSSMSQKVELINGQMQQSMEVIYTFVMEATKTGKFTIGNAEINVGGKKFKSNSITIEVVTGKAKAATNGNVANSTSESETSSDNSEIYLAVQLEKSRLIQGDYTVANIKLYTRCQISSIDPNSVVFPEFDGFYKQEIDISKRNNQFQENVNGQIYNVILLKKLLLIPQKSGELKAEPAKMNCVIQKPVKTRSRGFFDDFFGPSVREYTVKLSSKPLLIHVDPLPSNKPQSFNGTVGHFTMSASIDKNAVKTNDGITYKIVFSGKGNIKLIEAPKINFPPDFDTYDPKETLDVNMADGGIEGSKTFEYLIIPRNPGEFHIPALTYSYFDVATRQYKTLNANEFVINVTKSADNQTSSVSTGFSKEDIKYVGKDILFIKTDTSGFKFKNNYFFGSIWHWLSYFVAILVFVIIVLMRRRIIRQNSNIAHVRNKRADKFVSRRFKVANSYVVSNQKEQFYDELLKALWGYLSDKLNIPLSELSRETARDLFTNKGVDDETVEQFVKLVDDCEFARFSPDSTGHVLKDEYDNAIQLITKLQQKLR